MEKIYELEHCKIKVCFEKKLVRIYGDAELWRFLDGKVGARLDSLIIIMKKDYTHNFGQELEIVNDSLFVEIIVHVYCDYLGLKFNRIIKIRWIQNLVIKLLKRAEIVDCGEKEIDGNRWLWDYLAKYKKQIIKLLPKNLNSKSLK